MPDLTMIQFDHGWSNYAAGEVAGFSPKEAAAILGMRRADASGEKKPIAHIYDTSKAPAPAPAPAAVKPSMVLVQFTQHCGRYGAGEIAGFPADVARVYVEGGQHEGQSRPRVAEYYTAPAPAPATEPDLSLEPESDEKPAPPRLDRMVRGDSRHDKRG